MLGENVACVKFLFGRKVFQCGVSCRAGMRPSRAYGQHESKRKMKDEDAKETKKSVVDNLIVILVKFSRKISVVYHNK